MINPIGKNHGLNLDDEKEPKGHIASEQVKDREIQFSFVRKYEKASFFAFRTLLTDPIFF